MPPSLHVKARQILDAALTAAHAGNMLGERLQLQGDVLHYLDQRINLKQYQRIFVIGAGKASATMAREMESLLGDRLTAGAVVSRNPNAVDLKKIKAYPGDHPIVNENSLKASEKILDLTNDLKADDLVFVLISGGGSALLENSLVVLIWRMPANSRVCSFRRACRFIRLTRFASAFRR
jgi:glycerate 2-kinase